MDIVRVGFIGAGAMANSVHYPSLASFRDVEIAAICDLHETRLKEKDRKRTRQRPEEVSRKYGIKPYEDSMEMYKGEDIDAVTICVWSSSLAQEAIKALKMGKHVFIEKPMGHRSKIGRENG